MKKTTLIIGALLGGLYLASASIIPYEWWQMDTANRALGPTFNQWTVGSFQSSPLDYSANSVVVSNFGPGGPLGGTNGNAGVTRTTSANAHYDYPGTGEANLWASFTTNSAGSIVTGGDLPAPPAYPEGWSFGESSNWVMEFWFLALEDGTDAGATNGLIADIGSGSSGGAGENSQERWGCEFWTTNAGPGSGVVWVKCMCISTNTAAEPSNTFQLGPDILVKNGDATNRWMHFAVVRDDAAQTVSFYTNGVLVASTNASVVMINQNPPNVQNFPGATGFPEWFGTTSKVETGGIVGMQGYLSDLRFSTFAEGAFSVTNLLTRPPGPSLVQSPASITAFTNGQAVFQVIGAYDTSLTYQWYQGSTLLTGATASTLIVPATSNTTFSCVLKDSSSLTVTSAVATLTVTPTNAMKGLYQNAVLTTPGLVAYFPVDNDTGSTLTDTIGHNDGTLEGGAYITANTNTAFGQEGLYFPGQTLLAGNNGDVTISNKPNWEFGNYPNQGFGTVEAILYVDPSIAYEDAVVEPYPVWFSSGSSSGSYLTLAANSSYIFVTVAGGATYSFPANIVGKLAHVAVVFDNGSNITVYVNGIVTSAGTISVPNLFDGATYGNPFYIGWDGVNFFNYTNEPPVGNQYFAERNLFHGGVDELAIYSNNLSAATIAQHYVDFFYGTNAAPPSIASQSMSQTLLAGGNPELTVVAGGSPPFTYGWTSNGLSVAGATNAVLDTAGLAVGQSATYQAFVTNFFGSSNSAPITLSYVIPPDAYSTLVMSEHPVGYWRMDEPNPTNGATAYDQAGAHNGTYFVASGHTGDMYSTNSLLPGISDPAIYFNGAENADLCNITVPYSAQINPNGPFTLECFTIPGFSGNGGEGALVGSLNGKAEGYAIEGAYYQESYEGIWGNGNPNNSDHIYTDGDIFQKGQMSYVALVYDGTTLYLYRNNRLDASAAITFVPNSSAPLIIGGDPPFGLGCIATPIDEVAVYDYALTAAQLSNHYAFFYTQPAVTQQPVGVTNVEGSTITLSAQASGYPNTFQWYFDGNPLAATANLDGTAHYPDGVTGTTLEIAETQPSDSGAYYMAVSTPVGNAVSSNAIVLITPNTIPPTVESVIPLGSPNTFGGPTNASLVKVVFTRRVNLYSAEITGNYTFNPSLAVNGATVLGLGPNDIAAKALGADYRVAILQTAGMTPGQNYSVTISGVTDQSETPLTVPTSTNYFRGLALTAGAVNWDYYYLGTDSGASSGEVSALTGDINYPYAPMTNTFFTAFDSDQITLGNLSKNPNFGSLGDDYGDVVSAWITPTVTGTYTFFLWSDNASELDMSPDANPSDVAPVATEAAAASGFTEPTNTPDNDSAPIALVAGQSYFIRTLHAAAGNGDYVKVAWRISTNTTPAADLTPIPGSYLSAYANLPPQFSAPMLTNGILTLNWSGSGAVIQASTNLLNWTNVPGNPSPLVVPVNSGTNTLFFRVIQSP